MTDIRRTVLWVVFTFSLLLLWDAWQRHNGRPSMFGGAVATSAAPASAPPNHPATHPAAGPGASVAPAPTAPVAGDIVTIETDRVRAQFDTLGGSLVQVELLGHADDSAERAPMKVLERSRHYAAQTGLVEVAGAPNHTTALRLVSTERKLAEGAQQLNLRFESEPQGGLKLVKTYTLERGSYAIKVRHEVQNVSETALQPRLYLQLQRDGSKFDGGVAQSFGAATFTGPAIYHDKIKYTKVEFGDLDKKAFDGERQAQDGWVAMAQHFFVSAWLRETAGPREFFARRIAPGLYTVGMLVPLNQIAPGATAVADDVLFVGPQEEKNLAQLAHGFDLVKDYGWFHILAKPLFWLLDQIHKMVGNWGWAIVLLVVLLKIAFYGLNASAYKSMAKMKKVNPRIMELRERLKDNPQQMQQEMMRLYKEEKVNPLGSCLPMLLQIPFFIALYWVLLSSVEMRHAPWLGWITDLSAKDPWYVLPALMTASSLLQVWLQPAPPDPMQAKLMWIMPLMFSFMFFFFPAGLVLYWLVNNLLSIAQQWMINKQLGVTH
ncbi:membrane protein insertase YidC [Inhella gelatinilytica]|uniref:Membrane protein insertase YidC n=1 Tax=Inhella gelatinilytica TaxID=2795030 RepID=A0A931IVI2_9BURK|nr:membrane protein insertase YidC [Inhella gelatinilytica]MBH9551759.1 membrane protein insertase YidC [Inhella gelatinilytica]